MFVDVVRVLGVDSLVLGWFRLWVVWVFRWLVWVLSLRLGFGSGYFGVGLALVWGFSFVWVGVIYSAVGFGRFVVNFICGAAAFVGLGD